MKALEFRSDDGDRQAPRAPRRHERRDGTIEIRTPVRGLLVGVLDHGRLIVKRGGEFIFVEVSAK